MLANLKDYLIWKIEEGHYFFVCLILQASEMEERFVVRIVGLRHLCGVEVE